VQRTDAETRNLLTRMVERGWAQPRGEGKSRNWHLSAAVYRALDAPWSYQEAGGRVLRAQPDQIGCVLRRSFAVGTLAHQAVNKARFYTLAAKPGH
jgi:hypothetical protein